MNVVACYCHDFLKADMQHVYRQIVSLNAWQASVICQKRENAESFPFSAKWTAVLPKPTWRWARRNYYKYIKRAPLQVTTGRVIELLKEVYRNDASVVHIYFGHIAIQLLPFIKACPKPVVVSFHGADVGVNMAKPAFSEALQGVFDHAALILARSESLLDGLRKLGCPPEKLRLQRTGIPLAEWRFQERPWPADGQWRLMQACRLVPKKGLRTTLTAFKEITQHFPNASLSLAGDGPMREELQSLAQQWGIAQQVHFPGFLKQPQLRELTYASHLFFHPSETPADGNREGVPNAMLEAMSSGLPVLATHHGGIPEAIDHNVSGCLVEEGDSAGLAREALALMRDEAHYRRIAKGGSDAVAEKFERGRQTAILESYYTEAANLS